MTAKIFFLEGCSTYVGFWTLLRNWPRRTAYTTIVHQIILPHLNVSLGFPAYSCYVAQHKGPVHLKSCSTPFQAPTCNGIPIDPKDHMETRSRHSRRATYPLAEVCLVSVMPLRLFANQCLHAVYPRSMIDTDRFSLFYSLRTLRRVLVHLLKYMSPYGKLWLET